VHLFAIMVGSFVAYTGTHDNDTAVGWFNNASEGSKRAFLKYSNSNGNEIAWDMIRVVWASVAALSIAPLQDFLSLGNEARMNYPGRSDGNWGWRVDSGSINRELSFKIRETNEIFGRLNK